MAQTFKFEELDEATRSYLTSVRSAQGEGAPGVFAPTATSMPGCGCIAGPIMIGLTLALTLTTWVNVIYDDPVRVALLQTAGLVVGCWLALAGIRAAAARKGTRSMAGNWVYVDPLHLYEAYREQVTVWKVGDATEAGFTHNYNNKSYQNSVVRLTLADNSTVQVTVNSEQRAEQMVIYVNYLAWVRSEGSDRLQLPVATIGGLAQYVARHDAEPKDTDGNINLNLIEVAVTEVPEEPSREGRALPSLLPYIALAAGGLCVFFVMSRIVNPPLRDDAIFNTVIKQASTPENEPRFLRAYLIDERNKAHREEVQKALAAHYQAAIAHVQSRATNGRLRAGMLEILESLRTADQPIVSLKVTELPPALAGAKDRQTKLREGLVGGGTVGQGGGIMDELGRVSPAVQPVGGVIFTTPPPPIGHQLIAFVEPPEDAKNAHIEIEYQLKPGAETGYYQVGGTVTIRTQVDAPPVATSTFILPAQYTATQLASMDPVRDLLVVEMLGRK